MLDMLDKQRLQRRLSPSAAALLTDFEWFDSIGSTNTHAIAQVKSDIAQVKSDNGAAGYVCMAQSQTAGRGRRGRKWVSPPGRNIYCSLVWSYASGVAAMQGLSLAVGVAIVSVLRQMHVTGVQLKWPNDIVYHGRKLGGVLIEACQNTAGCWHAVVGVGLNVQMPTAAIPRIDHPWTDIATIVADTRMQVIDNQQWHDNLWVWLLEALLPLLANFELQGFAAYRHDWQRLDAYRGQRIGVQQGVSHVVGWNRGVDEMGRLQLESSDDWHVIDSGDISLTGS